MVSLAQICTTLITVEDTLKSINPKFHSTLWLPTKTQLQALGVSGYPLCFHLPIGGGQIPYTSGERGLNAVDRKKPLQIWEHRIAVPLLIGQASNEMAPLITEADKYIDAFYAMINAAYTLGGTVEDTQVGDYEMGEMSFRDTKHFAIRFPVFVRVWQRVTVSP